MQGVWGDFGGGRRIAVAVAAAALIWVGGTGFAVGRTDTPSPAQAVVCDAPPRAHEDITELLARSSIATPAATTGGQTLPKGTPVDAATAASMETAVRHWLACQNAGEVLRAWSLFSDGYLFRLLSRQGGLSADAYAALATPSPSDSAPATLLEMRDPRALPDGRSGATVTIGYPSVPMPKTFFFYFTRRDGRLEIDGILGEISFSLP